jgi:transcriptional regulator
MLYMPAPFLDTDLPRLHEHIRKAPFATLVTVAGEGAPGVGPIASHIPLLLDAEAGAQGVLIGHLARANPQWHVSDLGRPALAIFAGPNAYISPSWYPSKREHGRVVPTWNYTVVHASGRLEVVADEESLYELVDRLTRRNERALPAPWNVTDAPAHFVRAQLKDIVGVRLTIETLEGKAKLSQNRPQPDREGVVSGLAQRPDQGSAAIAGLMSERGLAGKRDT